MKGRFDRYPLEEIEGMRVRVYKNLNEGCWSVTAMEGEFKGRVILYADELCLSGVKAVVSDKGRGRVRKNQVKNVHAYLEGVIAGEMKEEEKEIYYNPYTTETFIWKDTGEKTGSEGLVRNVWFSSNGKVYGDKEEKVNG